MTPTPASSALPTDALGDPRFCPKATVPPRATFAGAYGRHWELDADRVLMMMKPRAIFNTGTNDPDGFDRNG